MAGHKGQKHPGKQHPVVAVYPDGSMMGWFEFIKDVAAIYGGFDRHGISRACKGHNGGIYKGIRWCYKEEYDRLWSQGRTHELAYTLTKYQHPGRQASHPPRPADTRGQGYKEPQGQRGEQANGCRPEQPMGKAEAKTHLLHHQRNHLRREKAGSAGVRLEAPPDKRSPHQRRKVSRIRI